MLPRSSPTCARLEGCTVTPTTWRWTRTRSCASRAISPWLTRRRSACRTRPRARPRQGFPTGSRARTCPATGSTTTTLPCITGDPFLFALRTRAHSIPRTAATWSSMDRTTGAIGSEPIRPLVTAHASAVSGRSCTRSTPASSSALTVTTTFEPGDHTDRSLAD